MIDNKLTAPLSPPTSPHMSESGAKTSDYQWQPTSIPASSYPATLPSLQHFDDYSTAASANVGGGGPIGSTTRSLPQSQTSFAYAIDPSSRDQHGLDPVDHRGPVFDDFNEGSVPGRSQDPVMAVLQPATRAASAPPSPAGRLTPRSGGEEAGGEEVEDDELDLEMAEQGDEERPPMTAAELRAYKRKMKRFRLTHNQTRFLMSEFARQAHPDAAHRERLSREIPGLSPRQVQVWFQNRRAKLKRLTTDDRERMMRSRALPANFNMTHALQSPFGAPGPSTIVSTPMPSPGTFSGVADATTSRPLTIDVFKRPPEYDVSAQQYINTSNVTPALGSAASSASAYGLYAHNSPQRPPFGPSLGSYPGYSTHAPHVPRLHLHDRLGRPLGEAAGSPLRTSISYTGFNPSEIPQSRPSYRSSSFSEHSTPVLDRPYQPRSMTGPVAATTSSPYGLGFGYASIPSYRPLEQPQHQSPNLESPSMGSAASRRGSNYVSAPPIGNYSPFPTTTYSPPQMPQMPQQSSFSGSFPYSDYQASFAPATQQLQNTQHTQASQVDASYATASSHAQMFPSFDESGEHGVAEQDESEGGVPLPSSY